MTRSFPIFVPFILILILSCSSTLLPAVYAEEIPGSGEVIVTPLFKIIRYSVWYGATDEKVFASVTIKNLDDVKLEVNVALSVQDAEGNWHFMKEGYKTISLEPKSSQEIILSLDIPTPMLVGEYKAKITVWTNEPHKLESKEFLFEIPAESPHPYPNNFDYTWIVKKPETEQIRIHFERLEISKGDKITLYDAWDSEIFTFSEGTYLMDYWTQWVYGGIIKIRLRSDKTENSFGFFIDSVEGRALPTYYDERSKYYYEKLSYGISTYLVSLSRVEVIENKKDIVDKLIKPINLKPETTYLDLLKLELKSNPLVYPNIESILGKGIDIIKIILYIKNAIEWAFGDEIMRFKWIMFSVKFVWATTLANNHVNFIIVKSAQNEYDVYVVSDGQFCIGDKIVRIPDIVLPHYIGTYKQLPEIFIEKMK